jgi:hypothetical protein
LPAAAPKDIPLLKIKRSMNNLSLMAHGTHFRHFMTLSQSYKGQFLWVPQKRYGLFVLG